MKKKEKHDRDVQYQFAANGIERCGVCTMFVRPNACTAVEGVISDKGWCRIYSPRDVHPPQKSSRV